MDVVKDVTGRASATPLLSSAFAMRPPGLILSMLLPGHGKRRPRPPPEVSLPPAVMMLRHAPPLPRNVPCCSTTFPHPCVSSLRMGMTLHLVAALHFQGPCPTLCGWRSTDENPHWLPIYPASCPSVRFRHARSTWQRHVLAVHGLPDHAVRGLQLEGKLAARVPRSAPILLAMDRCRARGVLCGVWD